MTQLKSQVILPFFTNIPTDVITNVMHWETDDSQTPEAAAAEIQGRLDTFYTSAYGPGYGANYVNWNACRIKVYDYADPEPRNPVFDDLLGNSQTPGNSSIPTEVAIVLSYHAAPVSGVAAGRLRNRIYLGGWATIAMQAGSVSSFPTVEGGCRTNIVNAANALLLANTTALSWVVRSQATGVGIARQIVGGHVDNSPDTQRRRSVQATSRTVFPL